MTKGKLGSTGAASRRADRDERQARKHRGGVTPGRPVRGTGADTRTRLPSGTREDTHTVTVAAVAAACGHFRLPETISKRHAARCVCVAVGCQRERFVSGARRQ